MADTSFLSPREQRAKAKQAEPVGRLDHFWIVGEMLGGREIFAETIFPLLESAAAWIGEVEDPRIIEIDLTAGTSRDATRDAYAIIGRRSVDRLEPLPQSVADICDHFGVDHYSFADEERDQERALRYERADRAHFQSIVR